ncbi:ATP-binding cassette domain-containing protein [Vibrio ishigakensis]|uniref:ATP-binding cassette domain-containing protein n=1 Tax=Vibrio ishigakensis TaxID=1481914 RepID=UPI0021C3A77E|nr:ATP-binding cassette domain-containing protein [Vibrio ishigakensis]
MRIQGIRISNSTASLSIKDWQLGEEHWGILTTSSDSNRLLEQLLMGDIEPESGEISQLVDSVECVSLYEQQKLLERELANDETDFQDSIDYGSSVEQLISELGCSDAELEQVIQKTDLIALRDRPFRQLSTGETRRLMLARALVKKPKLLVLDEPYSGLDIAHRASLTKLLDELSSKMQLIVMTSREDEFPSAISHLALFDNAQLSQTLSIQEWHDHPLRQQALSLSESKSSDWLSLMEGENEQLSQEPLIKLTNAKVEYLDGIIFKDFNWQMDQGQHWQIRGPNGCGKSTLLGLIVGDHPQCYANDIQIFGIKRGSGESIWDVKKRIGIVSSSLHLQYRVGCSVLEVLLSGYFDSIGLYEQPSKKQLLFAERWLEVLEMSHLAKTGFRQLDYGQQRLLLVARALIKRPQLLVLDEPYQGLDFISRKLVHAALEKISSANLSSLLYVTHYQEDELQAIRNFIDFEPLEEGHKLVTSHK